MGAPEFISQDELFRRVSPAQAVDALIDALRAGFDPALDLPRTRYDVSGGTMMLMPASVADFFGVKVLSLASDAASRAIPLIQGSYLLFDAHSMAPVATIDGAALTALRTPAVSLAGVRDFLVQSGEPLKAVIMGTGLQARAHEDALRDVLDGVRDVEVTYIGRSKPEDLEAWCESGSAEADAALGAAGLVITATSATQPIVTAAQLREDAIVVAMGAHTADTRELAGDVFAGATVIVEDVEVALREAGDVVLAIKEGHIQASDLIAWKDAVDGTAADGVAAASPATKRTGRVVFKTTGMPWEDVVVAAMAYQATAATT
ncbi:ornithine cyclodeaminase family protein [Corynebacterium aquatimens]|uniref:ornithine cyclodeaminase family protein n=1 Tax=Corynebacterium TaxID=1716 RepID=UPI001F481E46|nr:MULTISPECIES: ornithine cyclodeaminase family protein [Corynebacterium]QYH19467.1 ornithine cyclodeaminase family protein [Corynebacterium aquatimens]UIZ91613.1 ornithine cyclodeaminase family protein [Corynebacterium sp. CNCTC7651]